MSPLAQILPPCAQVVDTRGDVPATLFAPELSVVARAIPQRRREFATVRACARDALARFGCDPVPIVPGAGGAPTWPPGIVGSMTHCHGYRAAAVARAVDLLAIGVDAEPLEPLPAEVAAFVATDSELAALPRADGPAWDRLLFSAKESVYKAWYPLGHRFLDYQDVDIRLHPDGRFSARLRVPGVRVGDRYLDRFDGRWLATDDLVITACVVASS